MASLDDLIAAALGGESQAEIAKENPYLRGVSVADQINALIPEAYSAAQKQAPSSKNLKEAAIASALTGLVSGAFERLGSSYQNTLTDRYTDVFANILKGDSSQPENVPDSIFNLAKRGANIFGITQKIEDRERQKDLDARLTLQSQGALDDTKKFLLQASLTADRPEDRAAAQTLLLNIGKPAQPQAAAAQVTPGQVPVATAAAAADDDTFAFNAKGEPAPVEQATPVEGAKPPETAATGTPSVDEEEYKILSEKYGFKFADKVIQDREKERVKQTLKKQNWFQTIPAATQTQLIHAYGLTKELNKLAEEFKSLGLSAAQYQAEKHLPGTKANLAYTSMNQLLPGTVKLLGDVGNLAEKEQQRILDSTLGNMLSGSRTISERITSLANRSRRISLDKLKYFKTAIQAGGDKLIEGLESLESKPATATEARKKISQEQLQQLIESGVTVRKVK